MYEYMGLLPAMNSANRSLSPRRKTKPIEKENKKLWIYTHQMELGTFFSLFLVIPVTTLITHNIAPCFAFGQISL